MTNIPSNPDNTAVKTADGATTEATLYCANHPNVETLLRCNKCDKPICMKCAVRTSVGFRCRECINAQQAIYYNAESFDNPIAFAVGLLTALFATPIVGFVLRFSGFFGIILAFVIGSAAGGILAQIIRWAVGRRRGRYLRFFAIAGVVLGVLGGSVLAPIFGLSFPLFNIPVLIFTFLAAGTAYQILR